MIEKIKAVNNPLTIIAIFAALAEVAGTVALAIVDKPLQNVFIWFVMLFPALLVALFFATLNFNPKVLYAPSDFKDEQNFLNSLNSKNQVFFSLETAQEQLEAAKIQIIEDVRNQLGGINRDEDKLIEIFESNLKPISETVQVARESAESAVNLANQLNQRLDKEAMAHNQLINYIRLNIHVKSSPTLTGIDVEHFILSHAKQAFGINPTILFKNQELFALGIGLPEWVPFETAKRYVNIFRSSTGLAVVESFFSGTREVRG
jgi:hypothetical protein